MKYLVLLVQLVVSILTSLFLIGIVTVYIIPNLSDIIPPIFFMLINLSIIYLFMKVTTKIARKLGLPTVNIKGM